MDDKKAKVKKENKEEEFKMRIEDLENQLKRAVADYRNLEKRFEDEKVEIIKFANKDMLLKLFPAFDALFLAEQYVKDDGLKLTIKKLYEVLQGIGVEKIKTETELFDPIKMECVEIAEGEENKVLKEIRPGFTMHGKILRVAQVTVGKTKADKKEEEKAKEEMLKGDYV